jgi:hypothetical protein
MTVALDWIANVIVYSLTIKQHGKDICFGGREEKSQLADVFVSHRCPKKQWIRFLNAG